MGLFFSYFRVFVYLFMILRVVFLGSYLFLLFCIVFVFVIFIALVLVVVFAVADIHINAKEN